MQEVLLKFSKSLERAQRRLEHLDDLTCSARDRVLLEETCERLWEMHSHLAEIIVE